MRGPGSIPTGGNILSLDFFLFLCSKDKNANIGIFRTVCEKLEWELAHLGRYETVTEELPKS